MSACLNKVVDKSYLSLPYRYTEAEAMCASAVKPLHCRKRTPLVQGVLQAVEAVSHGLPTVEQWRELADGANITETLITMGAFADPDGLFVDAVNAVAELGRRHGHGQAMRLNAEQLMHLTEFGEAYQQMLEQTPARTYIRAHRATERRLRELLWLGLGDNDHEFIVN